MDRENKIREMINTYNRLLYNIHFKICMQFDIYGVQTNMVALSICVMYLASYVVIQ